MIRSAIICIAAAAALTVLSCLVLVVANRLGARAA